MRPAGRVFALAAALAVGCVVLAPAAGSASEKPPNWIGVGQTVITATKSTGKVEGKPRVFTQVSANGHSSTTLKVPMSSSGFRNLSGLNTPPVKDGYAVWTMHLSGQTHARAEADFPAEKLPLTVTAAYQLNGKKMSAKDIVGKSGKLKVSYVITNVTAKPTKVTFKNALGAKETTTVKAPIPMAAVLSVTLPADFTNVKAPSAGTAANGNGTSAATWTLFLFNPLGGTKQSVSYEAQVSNVNVPSATLEAQAIRPQSVPPLPTIPEAGAPAVPTLTLGGHLAALQSRFQNKLGELSHKTSEALAKFKQVAVPAAKSVSGSAEELATSSLPAVTETARRVSSTAETTATGLGEDAVQAGDNAGRMSSLANSLSADASAASEHASREHEVRANIEALPPDAKRTHVYSSLLRDVTALEERLSRHAARLEAMAADARTLDGLLGRHAERLEARAVRTRELQAAALEASTNLTTNVDERASNLSAQASEISETLAGATLTPREGKAKRTIHPKQVGGGAHLDAAVGRLDSTLTHVGNEIDKRYAYLKALDKRSSENLLPAGNAIGATYQVGAFLYSIEGASNAGHEIHLAGFIGGFALTLGLTFGIALYRMRRGLPSSLAPPKSPPEAAKS